MKKIHILFIFSFFFKNIIAQLNLNLVNANAGYHISYSFVDNNNQIVNTRLGFTEKPFSKENPGYISWYEFGDGKFTFKSNFTHYYANSNFHSPMLKVAGIYESGGRPSKPTRIVISSQVISTGSVNTNANYEDNFIPSNKNINIIPNIGSISHGDTMHFAVCYQIPEGKENWKLVFEYNKEGEAFEKTTDRDYIIDHYNTGQSLPFVRTHFGESPQYYDNKIEFPGLQYNRAYKMRTVFITLVPNKNTTELGGINAYLISDNNREVAEGNNANLSMNNFGPGPHDPNYITVDKKCITPNTQNKVLFYKLHFQNTGVGPSNDSVRIAIKLPDNLTVGGMPLTGKTTISKVTFSNVQINNIKPFNSRINNNTLYQSSINTVYFDNTRSDSLVFNFVKADISHLTNSNIILHGMDTTKTNFMNDKLTMGDIEFSVVLPSYRPRKNLYAQANIIFDTEKPVSTEPEFTRVRRRCGKKDMADCCKGNKKTFREWIRESCE
jgi:hypothetical protein